MRLMRIILVASLFTGTQSVSAQDKFPENATNAGSSAFSNKSSVATVKKKTPVAGDNKDSLPAAADADAATLRSPEGSPYASQDMYELEDFGIQATMTLHAGQLHGPTPTRLPGGFVITTGALFALTQQQSGVLLFDVLDGAHSLPNAYRASPASAPGSFDDQTQQLLSDFLIQVTNNQSDVPLVFYCQSVNCWMSYNAALRAVNLGYTQVMWYRGGVEAWGQAGLRLQTDY